MLYWKACQIPLHIGVLLFVMISGYFQIKTSLKGVVHILIITFVYYVPVEIIIDILNGNYDTILKHLMFLSNGPYWFISTYLMLYLLAPVINLYISISSQKRYYLTVVTGIFAVYFGSFSHDLSLLGGKNIINFIFLYLLGYNIKVNKCQFEQIKIRYPVIVFCLLNTLSIITYINQMSIRGVIMIAFEYCSPLLIISALCVFVVFLRFEFKSIVINYISKSAFSMYLIHHQPHFLAMALYPICFYLHMRITSDITLFFCLSAITIAVMVLCLFIDKVIESLCATIERHLLNFLRPNFKRQ